MGTKQFDNFADLITFTRASGGTALRPISYGSELVTNGTFDADSDWTYSPTYWSISAGQASMVSTSNFEPFTQDVSMSAGVPYLIAFDVIAVTGDGKIQGNTEADFVYEFSSTGSKSFVVAPATVGGVIKFARANSGSSASFTIDNISVKEVLFDQPNAPLTLFNHPTNIPRIEYDADGNRLGLLIEEQRTNLLTYSSEFDNAAWGKEAATVTSNATTAPDGTATADKLVETAVNDYHNVKQNILSSTDYVLSVYAKDAGDSRYLTFAGSGIGGADEAPVFDLVNGTVDVGGTTTIIKSASIESVGDGWYRCVASLTSPVTANFLTLSIVTSSTDNGAPAHTGDGTSGIYIWGAQLEEASFPTSYIPTSGSTATRAADVASIPTSAFGYNQSEGTVVVHAQAFGRNASAYPRVLELNDGTGSNRIMFFPLDFQQLQVEVSGITQATLDGGTIVYNQFSKYAGGIKAGNFNLSLDGSPVVSDTSGSMPAVTTLRVGADHTGSSNILNGHIKSIKYYPRRLTNDQLQELTQ